MARFTPGFLQNFEKILLPFVECKIWTAHLLRDVRALKSVVPRAMKTKLENIDQLLEKHLNNLNRQFLHAKTIGFIHPKKEKKMIFNSILPSELEIILKMLKNTNK